MWVTVAVPLALLIGPLALAHLEARVLGWERSRQVGRERSTCQLPEQVAVHRGVRAPG